MAHDDRACRARCNRMSRLLGDAIVFEYTDSQGRLHCETAWTSARSLTALERKLRKRLERLVERIAAVLEEEDDRGTR